MVYSVRASGRMNSDTEWEKKGVSSSSTRTTLPGRPDLRRMAMHDLGLPT